MLRCFEFLLAIALFGPATQPKSAPLKTHIYPSPDSRLRAVFHLAEKTGGDDVLTISTSSGKRISWQSFSSDENHGRLFVRGSWTPDSQFFVWSMENAGGHSPWNWPTFFFSRRSRMISQLDRYVGGITSSDFTIRAPDVVQGTRLERKTGKSVGFSVHLSKLKHEL